MPFSDFGMFRVAVATPHVHVANPLANAREIQTVLQDCQTQAVGLVVFPELCLTGYTCADLFHQASLTNATQEALDRLLNVSASSFQGMAIIGLPWVIGNGLYNMAAVLHGGKLLGLVPKSFLPNYKEFYERRWFTPGTNLSETSVNWNDASIPIGTDLLFFAEDLPGLMFGIEICEDLWLPIPPSSRLALAGATVLVNPSASTELVGKSAYRRMLVASQSGRCVGAYLYAGSGVLESTTDVIFGGHSIVAENGVVLGETKRFERQSTLLVADIDLERLTTDRMRQGTFQDATVHEVSGMQNMRRIGFRISHAPLRADDSLRRHIDAHPFVPVNAVDRDERCDEIFHIQVAGLAKRLETVGKNPLSLGVSGGLDSTLALLVACKTLDALNWPRRQLTGYFLRGFGSSERSEECAHSLIKHLQVNERVVDIRELCLEEMRQLGHKPFGIDLSGLSVEDLSRKLAAVPPENRHDLIFENIQARMRTSILMNAGFVVGTGDLSELALGWCTYNGDHMSMYNPNIGVPKTLVRFLVRWVADQEMNGPGRQLLHDIAASVITPELLPTGAGEKDVQDTEQSVGPYELQDFYLYYFLRFGFSPKKLLFLAQYAHFDKTFTAEDRQHWLRIFIQRFFANQFKRSCLPDGPKVGTVSLSPRGDWRMPSDASAAAWLE